MMQVFIRGKKVLCIALALLFVLSGTILTKANAQKTPSNSVNIEKPFGSWNDSAITAALQAYIKDITDKSGKNYIPVIDRVAVFDMDGTLIGEQAPIYFEWMLFCHRILDDPTYNATPEQIAAAGAVLEAARSKNITPEVALKKTRHYGEVFADMTTDVFRAYVKNFIQKTYADGFENLMLEDAYFRPMVEIVSYLKAHDFTVYVVSGTDRDATRTMIADLLKLPKRHIIGSDWFTKGSKQGEHKYQAYQLAADEKLLRDSTLMVINNVMGKTIQIAQEIGQKPVLAFGNTSGDFSMFTYTTYHNKYLAKAFCVIPDDDAREYAFPKKAQQLIEKCQQNGWHPISMKNDFKTIYAHDVKKKKEHTPWINRMQLLYEKRIQK